MTRRRLTWVIAAGVLAVSVAVTVDAVRSSEPSGSDRNRAMTEWSAGRETSAAQRKHEPLPHCTAQNIGVSIDVLGGTATVVVQHVWGRPCHLVPVPVRLSVTNRFGGRVRLATVGGGGPDVQSRVGGEFSPGFEQLIDIPCLANPRLTGCNRGGPFTAFVIVGPHSAQRKLSGSEVGC
jgi:hypothetical protein